MKVDYISDLHLDHYINYNSDYLKIKNHTERFLKSKFSFKKISDVLIIAGDISHYNEQTYASLEYFSNLYKYVLVVLGNHDYYLVGMSEVKRYESSLTKVNELFEMVHTNLKNVYMLDFLNEILEIDGFKIIGRNMWYPLETPKEKQFFHCISNDSSYIYDFDVYEQYLQDKKYIENYLPYVDLVVTHTPLLHLPSHTRFNSTACYLAPIELSVLPNYMIFGHTHEKLTFKKANSTILMNCWGYEEHNIEIKTFEL